MEIEKEVDSTECSLSENGKVETPIYMMRVFYF